MKKRIISVCTIFVTCMCLSACGGLSGKVSQNSSKIEIGSAFNISDAFKCKDGISIQLKSGENIDTSSIGKQKAVFVISDGEKTEETEFSFEIVDTLPPEIEGVNTTIYKGSEFDPSKFVSCIDNSGETITAVVVSNNVDTSTEGQYSVDYKATDSSGNSSEKTINVQVLAIDTAEDVMDLIDEYINKNGYSEFKYNKNSMDAVFVTGPDFSKYNLNSDRTLRVYPEIYMLENVFEGHFAVSEIIFRMELKDTGEQSGRYNLAADKMDIKSNLNSISLTFDGIPSEGDFEKSYYTSRFCYELGAEEVDKLKSMVDEGAITFDIKPQNQVSDYSTFPIKTTYTTVPITYELSADDISTMKRTLEIYDYLLGVLGQY